MNVLSNIPLLFLSALRFIPNSIASAVVGGILLAFLWVIDGWSISDALVSASFLGIMLGAGAWYCDSLNECHNTRAGSRWIFKVKLTAFTLALVVAGVGIILNAQEETLILIPTAVAIGITLFEAILHKIPQDWWLDAIEGFGE